MIQEFSVENYLSISDKQTLSFIATSDKSNLEDVSVEVKPGLRLLRLALLYGANASGKAICFLPYRLCGVCSSNLRRKSMPKYLSIARLPCVRASLPVFILYSGL